MASSAVCAGKTTEARGNGVTPSFLAPVLEMHAGWGALPRTLGKSMEEKGLFPGMYISLSVQFHSPTGRPFTCQEQPGEKTLNNFSLKNTALGHLSD